MRKSLLHRRLWALSFSVALLLGVPATIEADSFELIAAFASIPKKPMGRLLEVADGVFYGTASAGGAFSKGAVFLLGRQTDGSWVLRTVHSFRGTDGAEPVAGLVLGCDGSLYGTTQRGGAQDAGTVFRMTPLGSISILHSFAGGAADGLNPTDPLVQAVDGTLWGTTPRGGSANEGTVFRITAGGDFRLVHSFASVEGSSPSGGLIQGRDGAFYGTTEFGGPLAPVRGTAFRMTGAGALTVLYAFGTGADRVGFSPTGGLVQGNDGNFYGTTSNGGDGCGTVFKLTSTSLITVLRSFACTESSHPSAPLLQAADGNLYGTTIQSAPPILGSAFRIDPTGDVVTIATFETALGGPPSALAQGRDGFLYGTTPFGGLTDAAGHVAGFGTAFRMTSTGSPALVHSFSSAMPVNPIGRLAEGSNGVLYGTSCAGGLFDRGTVFKVSERRVTTLHSFSGSDGVCPFGGVVVGPEESLYGTTQHGGTDPNPSIFPEGTVFRIAPDGQFTSLHTFPFGDNTPTRPMGRLAFGLDGNLYGATSNFLGGNAPTVFRITPTGSLTALHRLFAVGLPIGGLLLATDGNFYGTTALGGDPDSGKLFRITHGGEFTSLRLPPPLDGDPFAPLVQAADGDLYGTAVHGRRGAGLVFKSTLSGATSVLHEFDFDDGAGPSGELLETAPGIFYGTTFGSAPTGDRFGTIFKMSADGTLTTVHRFQFIDGANPFSGLSRGADGALYGTTMNGGPGAAGVVFRIVPKANEPPSP